MLICTSLFVSLVASATGHSTFQQFWINGVNKGNFCVRLPPGNSPVTSVTSSDLVCNANAAATSGVCAVNAGDTVTVEMHQQLNDCSCGTEAIGGAHYGPIMAYMSKVADATTAGTQVLNDNCGHYDVKIPQDITPGDYLLRAEVIALHTVSSAGGAQFYMSCFQLKVSGNGTATPATVKIPGAYNAQDPGILINIHQQLNTYVIPGPTPYGQAVPTIATTAWPTVATWNTKLQPSTVPVNSAPAPSTTAASGCASPTSGSSGATAA
ncbi:lytic polysaccharide monooxygenase [Sphaerobolus stellatus SS14]|nr:lytic polysaccharide monooxygenase [Sphaerobolus stellatus SS14]